MASPWLERYFSAVVRYLDVNLPMRGILDIVGDGVVASDEVLDDGTKVTRLTIDGGGADTNGTSGQILTSDGAASFGTPITAPAGSLVGTTASQTLTNKTISGASNTISNVSLSSGVTGTLPGANMAAATTSLAGSMSAADKTKLDGIQAQGSTTAVAALAIDWSLSGTYSKTLSAGSNTITFSNATDGQLIVVVLTGAASTVTWPTVKWAGGVAPTQTASGIDVYTFIKVGSTIYGSVVQAMA